MGFGSPDLRLATKWAYDSFFVAACLVEGVNAEESLRMGTLAPTGTPPGDASFLIWSIE